MRAARLSLWILLSVDTTSMRVTVEATTGAMVIAAVLATASSNSVCFMYWTLLLGTERGPSTLNRVP